MALLWINGDSTFPVPKEAYYMSGANCPQIFREVQLLDTTFAATHCLSIRTDPRRRPGQIGVAFAPSRDRANRPEIAGVLWLTRQPLALRTLEFECTGIDQAIRDTRAGGVLEFETLANGVPIIRYWHIRSPRVAYTPAGRTVRGRVVVTDSVPVVVERHETGGLVASGVLADGTRWRAPLGALAGRVLDSRSDNAVSGAIVTLDSTDLETTSGPDGRFVFQAMLPGPYVIRVQDSVVVPRLRASTGGVVADSVLQQVVRRSAVVVAEIGLGPAEQVDVRLPWRAPVQGCHGIYDADRRFILLGEILHPDSHPLARGTLELSWPEPGTDGVFTSLVTESDDSGLFVVCGVPAGVTLTARVHRQPGETFAGTLRLSEKPTDERGATYRGLLRRVTFAVARVTAPGG